jgi:hypothetical protein
MQTKLQMLQALVGKAVDVATNGIAYTISSAASTASSRSTFQQPVSFVIEECSEQMIHVVVHDKIPGQPPRTDRWIDHDWIAEIVIYTPVP